MTSVLIPLAILLVFVWLTFVRPQRRRSAEHIRMQDALAPGDEVITAGGLHGTVVSIDETVLHVEIAAGTVVRVDRRAIAARVETEANLSEPESHEPSS